MITKRADELIPGDEVVDRWDESRNYTVLSSPERYEDHLLSDQVRLLGGAGGRDGWVFYGASAKVDVREP